MSIETLQLNEPTDTQIFEQVKNVTQSASYGDAAVIAIRGVIETVKLSSYSSPITDADLEVVNIVLVEGGWTGIVITNVNDDRFYRVSHTFGDQHITVETFRKTQTNKIGII